MKQNNLTELVGYSFNDICNKDSSGNKTCLKNCSYDSSGDSLLFLYHLKARIAEASRISNLLEDSPYNEKTFSLPWAGDFTFSPGRVKFFLDQKIGTSIFFQTKAPSLQRGILSWNMFWKREILKNSLASSCLVLFSSPLHYFPKCPVSVRVMHAVSLFETWL